MNGTDAARAQGSSGHAAAWRPRDIQLDAIDHGALGDHPLLFDLVVGASFVEISAEHYTRNLVDHCAGRDEVVAWLAGHWEPEELRHGEVLRDYALEAWPDFPWQAAYDDFFADYAAACSADELEGSRALEMAARCVVEVVKLRVGGIPRFQHFHLYEGRDGLHMIRGEPIKKAIHQAAPRPEAILSFGATELGQACHGALEGMGMHIDRRGHERAGALAFFRLVGRDRHDAPGAVDLDRDVVGPTVGQKGHGGPEGCHRQVSC